MLVVQSPDHVEPRLALADPRVKIFELGGNILHTDLLDAAMKNVHCVFHLAALWLLHCNDYPRSAFEVNMGGTFNVLSAPCEGTRLIVSLPEPGAAYA